MDIMSRSKALITLIGVALGGVLVVLGISFYLYTGKIDLRKADIDPASYETQCAMVTPKAYNDDCRGKTITWSMIIESVEAPNRFVALAGGGQVRSRSFLVTLASPLPSSPPPYVYETLRVGIIGTLSGTDGDRHQITGARIGEPPRPDLLAERIRDGRLGAGPADNLRCRDATERLAKAICRSIVFASLPPDTESDANPIDLSAFRAEAATCARAPNAENKGIQASERAISHARASGRTSILRESAPELCNRFAAPPF